MTIGGKRKQIDSDTKDYRKPCETNSKVIYSVPNHVDAPKRRFVSACFDPENEYNAVLDARYVEKQQFCSLPGAVNTVGDTILIPSPS